MDKILKKYDEYIAKGDIDNALRLLLYWKEDFEKEGNLPSLFTILNELEGFYRRQQKKDECFDILAKIIDVMEKLKIEENKSAIIPYINIATAYSAFSEFEKSYEYFLKAKDLLDKNDDGCIDCKYQYASLYNNMSTTLSYLGRYDEAIDCCEKAIRLNDEIPNGKVNSAITYLNEASIIEKRDGNVNNSAINENLLKAKNILDDVNIKRDMNYLFAASKCIDSFKHFNDFDYANEIINRIKEIRV